MPICFVDGRNSWLHACTLDHSLRQPQPCVPCVTDSKVLDAGLPAYVQQIGTCIDLAACLRPDPASPARSIICLHVRVNMALRHHTQSMSLHVGRLCALKLWSSRADSCNPNIGEGKFGAYHEGSLPYGLKQQL